MRTAENQNQLTLNHLGLIRTDGSIYKLRPQSLQVFEFLLGNPDEIISRERIHTAVWGEMNVTDDSLSQCIGDIRRALGDEYRHLLQTVPKKGYRLVTTDNNEGNAITVFASQPSADTLPQSSGLQSPQRLPFSSLSEKTRSLFFVKSVIGKAGLIIVVLLCVGAFVFLHSKTPLQTETDFAGSPLVMVLPFDNASSNPEQRYLSDGISEDIVTNLNRFSDLRVISWDAVSRINASPNDIKRITQLPSVRYLLSGSVRRSDDKIRITVRLTEAKEGQLIWADRYEEPMVDVFQIQDKISTRVATTVSAAVAKREPRLIMKKPEAEFQAYDFMLKGRYELRFRTLQRNFQARAYFEQAVALDPALDSAYVGLALTHIEETLLGWTEWPDRAMEIAKLNLYKAIEHNELNARAHSELARIFLFRGEHDLSNTAIARALEINPNSAKTRAQKGYNDLWTGKAESSIEHIEFSLEYDPYNPIGLNNLGVAYFMTERFKEAAATLEQAQSVQTEAGAYSRIFLTAVYAELNETGKAAESAEKILRIHPFFEIDNYVNHAPMLATDQMRNKLRNGLLKAGLE